MLSCGGVNSGIHTDGQKTKYREKMENNYSMPKFRTEKKCILKTQVQRGLYFTVFFQIQRTNVCIVAIDAQQC
jgi:hypothetical protein